MEDEILRQYQQQVERIWGKRKKEENDRKVIWERIDKLHDICREDLIKSPIKKLFRDAKCPECDGNLSKCIIHKPTMDVWSYTHFTCDNCDYEFAEIYNAGAL